MSEEEKAFVKLIKETTDHCKCTFPSNYTAAVTTVNEPPRVIEPEIKDIINSAFSMDLPHEAHSKYQNIVEKGVVTGVFSDSLIKDRILKCGILLVNPVSAEWSCRTQRRRTQANVKIIRGFLEPLIEIGYVVPPTLVNILIPLEEAKILTGNGNTFYMSFDLIKAYFNNNAVKLTV